MFKAITPANARKTVLMALVLTGIIKLILAQCIPVTGDEAYYAIWGVFPSWGGYDHTPFIGWLLYPFLKISRQQMMLRLPMILMTSLIGWFIYVYLKNNPVKAALASLAFLVSPLSLCGILITTDGPVILFSFLSGLCVLQALKKQDHLGWYALGGLFLGLGFFSKYFAVLLALSYCVYLLCVAPTRKRVLGLGIIFLCVLPFGLENIYWNYTHAWANILFNVYNRNTQDYFRVSTVLLYILTLFYIMTPPLFYYAIKHKNSLFKKYFINYLILVPLLFFLLLSTWKTIGLHWPLSFITFVYIWAGLYLSEHELKKSLTFLLGFTAVHVVLITAILVMPLKTIHELPGIKSNPKLYTKLVFFFDHKNIIDNITQHYSLKKYSYTSLDYVQADMLFYDTGYYAPTFGTGDVHGREDDLITNFKHYAHKNFIIFYSRPPRPSEYKPYFSKTVLKVLPYKNTQFYYIIGTNFNYIQYRNTVLRYINNTYWQIPPYLPHAESFFKKKYF